MIINKRHLKSVSLLNTYDLSERHAKRLSDTILCEIGHVAGKVMDAFGRMW